MGVVARESSGCDSPSCFSSSSPCSSSPSAGGSQNQSRQREKSRQGRNRERNLRDRPSLGRNHLEVENQSLLPSTMQSGQQNLLVVLVGGIWLAKTVPFVKRVVCSVDILCRTNATKNIPLRDVQEFKATL